MGKGENAGPTMCSKGFFCRVIKSWDCVVKGKLFTKKQTFQLVQIESICRRQIKVTQKQKFFFGQKENIKEKGENADSQHFLLFPQLFRKTSFSGSLKSGLWVKSYQHFLLFPQCFQKTSFSGSLKVGIVWSRVH